MDSSDQEKLKILIVDDESAARGLMMILLSKYGQCTCVTSGAEAIEAVTKTIEDKDLFDLICLDIMMPEMDGLDVLKEIRQLEQTAEVPEADRVKVLMVTAASQVSKTMRAFHYGCNGYIVKPISKEDLAKEINKLPPRSPLHSRWRGH